MISQKERREAMKWYNSVKIKLIGFFLFVSVVFLTTIIIAFMTMRDNSLEKNALKEAALMTSVILQDIRSKQTKAEAVVLTLASVGSKLSEEENGNTYPAIITSILSSSEKNNIDIISGGIWLENNISDSPKIYFFNRTGGGTFQFVKEYIPHMNPKTMAFYKLAQKTPYQKTAWTKVYIDPVTHRRMITVVSPVYRKGHFAGTASIDLNIQTGIKDISSSGKVSIQPRHYLMMLDKDGNFISKSKEVSRFDSTENIYRSKNTAIQQILKQIEPLLGHKTEKNTNCYASIQYSVHASTPKDRFSSPEMSVKERLCTIKHDPVLQTESIVVIYHFTDTHWNVIIGIPKEEVLASLDSLFYHIFIITIILTILATIAGYLVLYRVFVRPIESINKQLKAAISEHTLLKCEDQGEIGMLVENLNARTRNLEHAKARESREHELRLEQQEMLMQQSKMAMVGEMMDSVAHQWKQPLNALTLYSELIRNDFEEGIVDKAYVEEFRKNLQVQIDHMINTLDEFRSFFRPNKERVHFKLIDVVNSALFLAKDDILKNRILVKVDRQDEIEIYGFPNEFKHLILNIINNAKDAFIEHQIQQRLITINLIASEHGDRLEICDNAGGVPESVIDKIFEANITTKEEGKGTGIGLYMSQQIAQKHQAKITVENRNGGACFIVTFHHDLKRKPLSPRDIR